MHNIISGELVKIIFSRGQKQKKKTGRHGRVVDLCRTTDLRSHRRFAAVYRVGVGGSFFFPPRVFPYRNDIRDFFSTPLYARIQIYTNDYNIIIFFP